MKIVLTGGGTAGHISPALAVFAEIKRRNPGARVLYVGKKGGMEEELTARAGVEFKGVTVSGLCRSCSAAAFKNNGRAVLEYLRATRELKAILREFEADLVFATGGYVSAPVVRAALGLNIKVVMHEQNERPGLTTRIFGKKAAALLLPSRSSVGNLHPKLSCRLQVVGNPVAQEFGACSKEEARKQLGWEINEFCVVSFGGSLGAERINRAVADAILNLKDTPRLRWVHAAGDKKYGEFMQYLKGQGFDPEENKKISGQKYIFNMPGLLNAADVVISRAGAMSVAELKAVGRAAVLVPSPNVTNNHQFFNAKALAEGGACLLIEDDKLNGKNLTEAILHFLANPQELAEMESKMKQQHLAGAAEAIYELLKELMAAQ